MAQFTHKEMEAQKSSRSSYKNSDNNSDRVDIKFISSLLAENDSSVVVRFPYHSMDDIVYESVHTVLDYPGFKYGKRIRCTGDNTCKLCQEGVKVENRVFVKMLAYVPENNKMVTYPAIWDRPSAFADIDIKNLIVEYGDLSKNLFKIRRNGLRTDTRYTTSIVINNNVYNDNNCPADFSDLEKVDCARIFTKTYDQYVAAKSEKSDETASAGSVKPVSVDITADTEDVEPVVNAAPVTQQMPEVESNTQPAPTASRVKKYTF